VVAANPIIQFPIRFITPTPVFSLFIGCFPYLLHKVCRQGKSHTKQGSIEVVGQKRLVLDSRWKKYRRLSEGINARQGAADR
jgi:hypothetical protein